MIDQDKVEQVQWKSICTPLWAALQWEYSFRLPSDQARCRRDIRA